jgi:hypothetical protein
MGVSRYAFLPKTSTGALATSNAGWKIFRAVESGNLSFSTRVIKGFERLDHIASKAYGSSDMWWIIAAASGIGWGLQVPPGTIIRVPKSQSEALKYARG